MTSPLRSELPEDRETPGDFRDRFLDLIEGGLSSDLMAARVGLTEDGLEAGLRLGNAIEHALGRDKRDNG